MSVCVYSVQIAPAFEDCSLEATVEYLSETEKSAVESQLLTDSYYLMKFCKAEISRKDVPVFLILYNEMLATLIHNEARNIKYKSRVKNGKNSIVCK